MKQPHRPDSRSAKRRACARFRLQTRTRLRVRVALMDSRWVVACTPDPRVARSQAAAFARTEVAAALTAAVRMAVTEEPSMTASSEPWAASKRSTAPWWESYGGPWFPGIPEPDLRPVERGLW